MAVAAVSPPEVKDAAPLGLGVAGFVGAAYVLGALAVAFLVVPELWSRGVSTAIRDAVGPNAGPFVDVLGRALVQIAAAVALVFVGVKIAGGNPPKGIRGAITIAISSIFTVFFLSRAVGMWLMGAGNNIALIAFGVALAGLIYLVIRFVNGPKYRNWSISLEHGGWFSGTPYKRNQGQLVRRLTMLGAIILAGAGVYTLVHNNSFGAMKDWVVSTPFLPVPANAFLLMPDVKFTVPLVLLGLTLWLSYRMVNMPLFADFLVATEAELNKVSWPTRKRLWQDTMIVLVFMVLMTVFLFLVDVFWGWLLSRDLVGILPTDAEQQMIAKPKTVNVNKQTY